jgi:acyl-coenzyme A synthetase/AMP-(fatty) acid ligase
MKQKIPVEWHLLEELPRTASGKVRKNELVTLIGPGTVLS